MIVSCKTCFADVLDGGTHCLECLRATRASDRSERCSSCGKPTYAGEDFGGPCVHETDLACALAQRDEARAERDALIGAGCSPEQNALALLDLYAERTRDAEAERDEANANYCFMVQRAADEKLDGYRELGARAAAAENERDSLRRLLQEAHAELSTIEAITVSPTDTDGLIDLCNRISEAIK